MQKLSRDFEEVDYLVEMAQRHPETLLNFEATSAAKWKSIHQQLLELYLEESQRQPMNKKLRSTSHLLSKLVAKKHLNTLIVNMYPGNEGYSLMLRGRNGDDSETVRLPYEESDLLEYIDAEELPPVLVDLLDKAQANLFYSGCIVIELRDFRRSSSTDYDVRYVLLRPTPHTLLCDINNLTNDGHRWTEEDKFQLESQLLLHTSEPLCLDPSPTVFHISSTLHNKKHTFNTKALKRHVKKFSQVSVNKRRKLAECAAPSNLRLHDFVIKKRDRVRPAPLVNLKVAKSLSRVSKYCLYERPFQKVVDMWKQRDIQLDVPESIEVDKYAKAIDPPNDKLICNNVPVTIEEFTMESERSQGKVLFTKLTIQQRMSDDTYLGELYTDRDYLQGQPLKGTMCKFSLGTRGNVDKYIKQFTEIFTEEGRRAVKITHQVIGQKPTVTYTQTQPHTSAVTSAQNAISSAQAQNIITQATNLAASLAGQMGPGGDSKKAPPIKLSLQINPTAPGASPQGTPTPGSSSVTLTMQQQQLLAAQRARQMGLQLQKSGGASTTSGHLPTYTQALASGSSSAGSTPPPNVTVTTASKPIAAVLQVPPGDGSGDASSTQAGNVIPPNISITNLQGNVNITNIQGIIPGLQNVQVSLAGGTLPAGSITLPLNVLSSGGGSTSLTSPTGVIMSASSTQGGTLTSPPPLVSMVTGTNTSTSTTSSVMTTGHSNMIQLPLGVTQLIPTANLKNAPPGLRPGTPLSLVQVQGQPMQLLSAANLSQARGQIGQPPTAHPGTTSPRPVLAGQRPGLTLQPVQINPQQQQQLAQLHFQQRQQLQLQQQPQQQMKPPKSKKKKSKS